MAIVNHSDAMQSLIWTLVSEEFRRIFKETKDQIIFKWCNTLKTLLMHPKDKIPTQLCQDEVYKWTCPEVKLQFFLYWRIQQMPGKQGQRT